MRAFDQAEAELLAQQQPQARVITPAPVEKLKPLTGLAESVVSVDDEDEVESEPIEEQESILDEDERTELAVEAALDENEGSSSESEEECSEMQKDDLSADHESNTEV